MGVFRQPPRSIRRLLAALLLPAALGIGGCYPTLRQEARNPQESLRPVRYGYPEFKDDLAFADLQAAILRNLEYLKRLGPDHVFHYGPHTYTRAQVQETQEAFLEIVARAPNVRELNRALRDGFLVYRAAGRAGNRHVLFTGYFEPLYDARRRPDEDHRYPLYRRPEDLIKIDLSPFSEEFKGKSITARIEGPSVLPYYSRGEIEGNRVLEGRGLEIAWLRDPVDVAFLHIQGSGRLRFPDGSTLAVGYAAANGRPYRSIGRYMIDRGFLDREEVSMQAIRRYLAEHPDLVREVLDYNPSYIFFRTLENGPVGSINVPLTPQRSVALDGRLFPRGALCFVSSRKPVVDERGNIAEWTDFSRFVLNQDTGGAITGAGRADIFWGNGAYAELAAGHMKEEGDLYILIKRP